MFSVKYKCSVAAEFATGVVVWELEKSIDEKPEEQQEKEVRSCSIQLPARPAQMGTRDRRGHKEDDVQEQRRIASGDVRHRAGPSAENCLHPEPGAQRPQGETHSQEKPEEPDCLSAPDSGSCRDPAWDKNQKEVADVRIGGQKKALFENKRQRTLRDCDGHRDSIPPVERPLTRRV